MKNIINPKNIKIQKIERYPHVFSYILEDGYHFEAYGQNYGNIIMGMDELTNEYIVKKDETNTKKDC